MLLPQKHIRLAESLIGLSGFVLENLKNPTSIDSLWKLYEPVNNTEKFPAYHSFENFVLAIDFLFSIGIVTADDSGDILLCA